MYTVACSTDETKRLTLCSNRLLLYVFASFQLVHRGLTMTQKDLIAQVCTFYCFLFSQDLISKRFMISQSQFWQSINQSINQLINQSINKSINQSINQSINPFVNQPMDQPIKLHQFSNRSR